jgi:hypothetical protein
MKLLENLEYRKLMTKQLKEQLLFLLKNSEEFMIVVNMDGVEFNPTLPPEIEEALNKDFIPFAIGGYTFKSAFVENEKFIFEAGFGSENIGAMVYIDISRILQIVIAENPIFINVTATAPKETPKNSMEVFASKSRNQRFFKKS